MAGDFDAAVVGSGPNGLAAAIRLARAGLSVVVLERSPTIGGGATTSERTLPGFHHDVCSAIHPMGAASPWLRELDLAAHGLEWIHAPLPLAHPLEDGEAVFLARSIDETARNLGADGRRYAARFSPWVRDWEGLMAGILGPLRVPRRPLLMAGFGLPALRSATSLASSWFRGARGRALLAGLAAHSILPLDMRPSASIGLALGIAGHAVGWPMPKGGSQRISDALAAVLRAAGGEIRTDCPVRALEEVPARGPVLFDVSPRALAAICGRALPSGYGRRLRRFRHAPGSCKVDWALDGPIPWRAEACRAAGTIHVGGTIEEIARSERLAWEGQHAERPFVLVAQPSRFDPTRAPAGRHTAWAYCHVPNGSTLDVTDRIEEQIERFAPGFRERILARSTLTAADLERHNPNHVGGDIGGGAATLSQVLFRPVARWSPYATPNPRVFLCSASTPPGGGVHGMCGYHAAGAALASCGRSRAQALLT